MQLQQINLDSRANFFLAFENLMDALKKFLSLRFLSSAPLTSLFRPLFPAKPRIADPLCERKSALESRLTTNCYLRGKKEFFCILFELELDISH